MAVFEPMLPDLARHMRALVLMLLDLVEVTKSHSSKNLAAVFAEVLEEFGISDKVWQSYSDRSNIYLYFSQILSITVDNASNNDMMIEHLATLIESFPGTVNQTQCFTHILNLIEKSILCQFEAPKLKGGKVLDNAVRELAMIFNDLEDYDVDLNNNVDVDLDGGGNEDSSEGDEDMDDDVVVDNDDGLPDEQDRMSEEELVSLEKSMKPVWLVLTKVHQHQLKLLFNIFKKYLSNSLEVFPWP